MTNILFLRTPQKCYTNGHSKDFSKNFAYSGKNLTPDWYLGAWSEYGWFSVT